MQLLPTARIWRWSSYSASFGWPTIARITRGAVLSVKNNEFVMAAKALGHVSWRILGTHVLPNSSPPIIVTRDGLARHRSSWPRRR